MMRAAAGGTTPWRLAVLGCGRARLNAIYAALAQCLLRSIFRCAESLDDITILQNTFTYFTFLLTQRAVRQHIVLSAWLPRYGIAQKDNDT
jgi:hypothetical protein